MRDGATTSVGAIVAVGCETEPVSKNDDFRAFAERCCDAVFERRRGARRRSRSERVELAAKLGENIQVVGAKRIEAARRRDARRPTSIRRRTRSASLVQDEGRRPERRAPARDAHHVRPADLRLARRGAAASSSTPSARSCSKLRRGASRSRENVREKIVEGMLNKRFYAESVLGEQTWIHEHEPRPVAKALERAAASSSSTTPGTRSADGGCPAAQPRRAGVSARPAEALRRGADGTEPSTGSTRRPSTSSRASSSTCTPTGVEIALVIGGGNIYRGMRRPRPGHGPRDRRLHGHARDGVQLARGAGGARAERRRHARALGARRAGGGRAVHPPPRDPPPREGPRRDLRRRHRQPVLHDRHGGGAARARDRRRGDPDGEERRRGRASTATRARARTRSSCPSSRTCRRSSAA